MKSLDEFLTAKELDPDFVDFNSANRRYHFPARFYLPSRGQFGQRDPLLIHNWLALVTNLHRVKSVGEVLSRHRVTPFNGMSNYVYVASRPLAALDPWGAILVVDGGTLGNNAILKVLNELCKEGGWKADGSGKVTPSDPSFCIPGMLGKYSCPGSIIITLGCVYTAHPKSCCCICGRINSPKKAILRHASQNTPNPNTTSTADPNKPAPQMMPGMQGTYPADTTTTIDFGRQHEWQSRRGDAWIKVPTWQLVAHELCGHVRGLSTGTHALPGNLDPGGTWSEETDAVQNERGIVGEHSGEGGIDRPRGGGNLQFNP